MPDGFKEAAATPEPGVRVNVRIQQAASDAIGIHPRYFTDQRCDHNRGLALTREDVSEIARREVDLESAGSSSAETKSGDRAGKALQ